MVVLELQRLMRRAACERISPIEKQNLEHIFNAYLQGHRCETYRPAQGRPVLVGVQHHALQLVAKDRQRLDENALASGWRISGPIR